MNRRECHQHQNTFVTRSSNDYKSSIIYKTGPPRTWGRAGGEAKSEYWCIHFPSGYLHAWLPPGSVLCIISPEEAVSLSTALEQEDIVLVLLPSSLVLTWVSSYMWASPTVPLPCAKFSSFHFTLVEESKDHSSELRPQLVIHLQVCKWRKKSRDCFP